MASYYKTWQPESYWIVVAALVIGDQLSKFLVGQLRRAIELGPISISREVNPVGLFGLPLSNEALIVIGVLIVAAVGGLLLSGRGSPPVRLGLWLLLGGAVSNLIDRVIAGGAIDIIGIAGLTQFNLADGMILLGAASLIRGSWWRS